MSARVAILTTINAPTDAVRALASYDPSVPVIAVGDRKTPADWSCPNSHFLSIEAQLDSPFKLPKLLRENHYCRKNAGYLFAFARGAEVVGDTDDDNQPTNWPLQHVTPEVTAHLVTGDRWVNVYKFFCSERIWPRGYPLQLVAESFEPETNLSRATKFCPVHQHLAEGDPDVDAVYRLIIGKSDHIFQDGAVILDRGAFCPFNSQSTIWFKPAFPLMYLPSFVSFRMTDIWRSFVAQVCLWAAGWQLSYHGRGVYQDRNAHNLLGDFKDEVVGYERNAEIRQELLSLSLTGVPAQDLLLCYKRLEQIGVVPEREMPLVEAWLNDCASAIR